MLFEFGDIQLLKGIGNYKIHVRHIVHLELNLPCSVAEGFDAEKFLYVTAFYEEISWTHDSCPIFSTASHYMDFVY